MGKTYSYPVESYAQITNLDSSVLKLNPALQPYGFHFVKFRLDELEKKLGSFFGLPADFKPSAISKIPVNDSDQPQSEDIIGISSEFSEMLFHTIPGGFELLKSKEMVFLKRTKDAIQNVVNGEFTFESIKDPLNSITEFGRELVSHIRLFKKGDVMARTFFQVDSVSRKVISRYNPAYISSGGIKFIVSDKEASDFGLMFKPPLKYGKLSEVALINFYSSYGVTEPKAKFLMLMTCLEALFNFKGAEITHTISRHLAILLSQTVEEFQNNYVRVRKLYSLRSKIIHGANVSGNISDSLDELEDFVRRALKSCIGLDITHDVFFAELNRRGF